MTKRYFELLIFDHIGINGTQLDHLSLKLLDNISYFIVNRYFMMKFIVSLSHVQTPMSLNHTKKVKLAQIGLEYFAQNAYLLKNCLIIFLFQQKIYFIFINIFRKN